MPPDRNQATPPEADGARACSPIRPFLGEERREKGGAFGGADPTSDLELVVEPRIGTEVVERSAGTGPRVARPEDDPPHSGRHESAGAHGARLEGDDQRELGEPPSAHGGGGIAQGQDLGVCGRVACALTLVMAGCHDVPADQRHSADRNLSLLRRQPALRPRRAPWRPRRSAGSCQGLRCPSMRVRAAREEFGPGHAGRFSWSLCADPLRACSGPPAAASRSCRTARGTSPAARAPVH